VLVSEFMLQQTPVARVVPAYQAWLARWPTPSGLAAEPAGEAVRQWDRLGYPRRALNLHATARILTQRHGGEVPSAHEELLALPGVGPYTAAAVASFAFGQRHVVLDTNVRRVFARLVTGARFAPRTVSAAERRLAESLLPSAPATAARWAVAVMELGALVCTSAKPACANCPLAQSCAWQRAGFPDATDRRAVVSQDGQPYGAHLHDGQPHDGQRHDGQRHDGQGRGGPRRGGQRYEGTDRQCRGRLLGVLRHTRGAVPKAELDVVWPDETQRERALDSLVADGLVEPLADGSYALPG
jgi:A/G-specific adenine glycosylase